MLNQVITLTPPSPGIALVVNSPASASQDLAVSSVLDVNITNYNANALQFTDATVTAAVQSGLGLTTAVSETIRHHPWAALAAHSRHVTKFVE